MPGRIRSPGTRKGKGNHLQFRTNLFSRGKKKIKDLRLPSLIHFVYPKPIWNYYSISPNVLLAHPFSPLHYSPQPTCGSFHAATGGVLHTLPASPAIQSCPQTASARRPYPQPSLLCFSQNIPGHCAGSAKSSLFQEEVILPFIWGKYF